MKGISVELVRELKKEVLEVREELDQEVDMLLHGIATGELEYSEELGEKILWAKKEVRFLWELSEMLDRLLES